MAELNGANCLPLSPTFRRLIFPPSPGEACYPHPLAQGTSPEGLVKSGVILIIVRLYSDLKGNSYWDCSRFGSSCSTNSRRGACIMSV